MDAVLTPADRRHLRPIARAYHAERLGVAFVDVGGLAARPPHRNRLSARGHYRDCRSARPEGAAVAPRRRVDPEGGGRRQGLAGTDAGADPAVTCSTRP